MAQNKMKKKSQNAPPLPPNIYKTLEKCLVKYRCKTLRETYRKGKELSKKDIKVGEFYIDPIEKRIVKVTRITKTRVTFKMMQKEITTDMYIDFFQIIYRRCPKVLKEMYAS